MRRWFIAGVLLLAGCPGPDTDAPADTDQDTDTELPLQACEPALTLTPDRAWTEPYGSVRLTPAGGTGAYGVELVEDASGGASVDPATGSYAAGGSPGTTDRLRLTDQGCLGQAEAEVEVVPALALVPRTLTVRPGTSVPLQVRGGSGAVDCALVRDDSGGSVASDTCVYVAGPGSGTDRIRATDRQTGATADSVAVVDPDMTFRVEGHGVIFVPRGGQVVPRTQGGSGIVELLGEGGVVVRDGALVGEVGTSGRVVVTDAFTGDTVSTRVEVVDPLLPDLPRDGEATGHGVALALGDVDGDGYTDAALALTEASVQAYWGGMVAVYAGGPDGLEPTPVQVFSGDSPEGTFGRDIGAADVDGDGHTDLIIGADRDDAGETNTGTVSIHRGVAGGFFEEVPSFTLTGDVPYGRLGSAIAACDFDGDGAIDLAIGALDAHDDAGATAALDQGAVRIWRGAAGGPSARPDFSLFGVLPDGDGFAPAPGLHLGSALRAGDLDGDGKCDLVAAASKASLDGRGEDGVVFVYRGTTTDDLLLTRTPVAVIEGASTSELGQSLAVGDVTGDGAADLLLGAWQDDTVDRDAGRAVLFSGPEVEGTLHADDALWTVYGGDSGSSVGVSVDVAEVTGDGVKDALIGAHRWRRDGGAYSEGVVLVFDGRDVGRGGTVASALDEAVLVGHGAGSYDRFGQAVAGIGDASGDGRPDLLVLASRDNRYGIDVGAPAWVDGTSGDRTWLELPGEPSGHDVGRAIALFDVDGDGRDEVILGVPGAGVEGEGANAGAVFAAGLDAGGAPDGRIWDLGLTAPTHTRSDELGFDVASVGDFDGDGFDDLAVVSRRDSEPGAWDGDFVDPDGCDAGDGLTGMAWVYRGRADGLDRTPSFVIPGPERDGTIDLGRPAGDVDGDGYADLALASIDWDGARGGVAFARGRPAIPGRVRVVCDLEVYTGGDTFDQQGRSVTALGDLDGDGCDDVAVGAAREESHGDWYNQGVVRIFWGWGGPGCASVPRVTAASMTPRGAELGTALAGGHDVDGDGLPDLAVGGEAYRKQFGEYGGAWLVPGEHLLGLDRVTTTVGVLPEVGRFDWEPLMPIDGLEGSPRAVTGTTSGSLFGHAVALVGDPLAPGRAILAVGAPQGDLGGGARNGGVAVYRFTALPTGRDGLDTVPWAVLAGESQREGGLVGAVLAQGLADDGTPLLLVGAPRSSAEGLQVGAVYVLRLR